MPSRPNLCTITHVTFCSSTHLYGQRGDDTEMSMIKEKDRQALRQELKPLSQPVRLVLFTSGRNCEYCRETRDLLEQVAGLSDKLSVETYDLQRDASKAAQFQIDKAPG